MGKVYIIGTLDTKEAELRYARRRAEKAGATVVLVDVSTTPSKAKADVSAREVARHHPKGEAAVLGLTDRGAAVGAMAEALSRFMVSRKDVGAVLGLGGSGNTVIVTTAMRALPLPTRTTGPPLPGGVAQLSTSLPLWVFDSACQRQAGSLSSREIMFYRLAPGT